MLSRLLTAIALSSAALPACAEVVVQIKEFAQVTSRQVRLADIAVMHSGDPAAAISEGLGRTLVTTITQLNHPIRIDAKQVARLISRQLPALRDQFRLDGATAVTVIFPGEEFPSQKVVESAKVFLQQELNKMQYQFELYDAYIGAKAILVPTGRLQLRPRFIGPFKPATQMHVAVDLIVDGRHVDTARVGINIAMQVPAYQLTRTMAAGQTLGSGDYKLLEQPVDRLIRGATLFSTGTDLIGHRLRRNVAADTVLYRDDVEPTPYVSRSQKIQAELRSSGILIEKTVVAMSDGQLGQTIKVVDTNSSATYSAKVVAYGRVEVK